VPEPAESEKQQLYTQVEEQIRDQRVAESTRVGAGQAQQAPVNPETLTLGLPVSSAPGTGYRLDPDGLAAQIRTFEDLRDRSVALQNKLRQAKASATPPSPDPPAVTHAQAAADSLIQAAADNESMAEYAQGLIDALRKANGTYVQHEQDTSGVFAAHQDNANPLFRKPAQ
jgi:hypothetical protein